MCRPDPGTTGRFTHPDNLYETEVPVEGHRIADIRELYCEGDEYDKKALEVIRRVIETQSLRVDTVIRMITSGLENGGLLSYRIGSVISSIDKRPGAY